MLLHFPLHGGDKATIGSEAVDWRVLMDRCTCGLQALAQA
jgi:hypothetical protein